MGDWGSYAIPETDFDIAALHEALDARRRARGLTWKQVAQEVNRPEDRGGSRLISPSTISGLKTRKWGVEGDGVLQMLLWLDRTPESFVPNHPGANHPGARLPQIPREKILRFDLPAIHAALDAQRQAQRMTWRAVGAEIGGLANADTLTRLAQGQRTGFPGVMRLARWLCCPAAAFTRVADH